MPDKETYEIYKAAVVNTNELWKAATNTKRLINSALRKGDSHTIKIQTKIYSLIYCTFSEANFLKIILTPYGFEQDLVDQIMSKNSIEEKWMKCIELAFLKFSRSQKNSEIPNKKKQLLSLIKIYVISPTLIRNKIAHGQLKIALNKSNTKVNPEVTEQLDNINSVTVYKWFQINKKLGEIIEELIESPDKAHYKFYYQKHSELIEFIEKTKNWSEESKMKIGNISKPLPDQIKRK